jgi:hypothetical protein
MEIEDRAGGKNEPEADNKPQKKLAEQGNTHINHS